MEIFPQKILIKVFGNKLLAKMFDWKKIKIMSLLTLDWKRK